MPRTLNRVIDAVAEVEDYPFASELVRDIPRVGQRPSEAIKLGHHKGVSVAACGQGFAKAGPFPLGACESVIDVDSVGIHAGGRESVALGSQVLRVCGDTGVADKYNAASCV
jgi:hypothetical protein